MSGTTKKLQCIVNTKPRKLFWSMGPGSGLKGRLISLRSTVTRLLRYERLDDIPRQRAQETQQYVERLLHLAIKYGDCHTPTMEIMDHWILEKDLIHKLFKVFVPRYEHYSESFTKLYNLPRSLPGDQTQWAIIELKGNPWPPVLPKQREIRNCLTNILLDEARKDFHLRKQKLLSSKQTEDTVDTVDSRIDNTTLYETSDVDGVKETPV